MSIVTAFRRTADAALPGAFLLLFAFFSFASPTSAQATGALEGRVLTEQGGPAADAVVRVLSLGRTQRVDEDGRFRFDRVPQGSYLVEAQSARHGRGVERVDVEGGGLVGVEIELAGVYHLDEIVVSAGPEALRRDELFQAADALSGRNLRNRVAATLGETLAREPGVSSSYFGPASSRPVIRGLSGDRVRILESGVGTGDASNTSPDHAVSLEPQMAERIEVIRGPATLLYGSSAIGGVVNVIDDRVPSERPAGALTGELQAAGGTVAEERNVSGRVDGRAGRLAWQVSGLFRETGDYDIPGFAVLEEPGHEEEEPGHEEEEEEGEEGVLPNSALESWRASAGVSWVSDNGFVGVSFSGYDSDYGVPGGHGHHEEEEPGHEEEEEEEEGEGVAIDLQQRRFDLQADWRFPGFFLERVKARLGVTDYRHFEIEEGQVGTRFENDSWEGRLESQYGSGAFGVQLRSRDFSAIGEEAFIPPNETVEVAVFGLQRFTTGPWGFQLGARWELADVDATGALADRSLEGFSGSVGVNVSSSEGTSLALSAARSVKLPTAEELFSDGPHLATNSFDLGDPNLDEEVGWSLDLSLRGRSGPFDAELNGFVNDFDDFIFQEFTGDEEDELPVLRYTQADALFYGAEFRGGVEVAEFGRYHLGLEVSGDWVRAELSESGDPLPRIPPFRFGGGVRLDGAPWTADLRLRRVTEQDRTAPNEEATEGYTMLDASVGYRILQGGVVHELVLMGRNLTDQEARNHVSLLKEQAPLPGRDLRLMYRLVF